MNFKKGDMVKFKPNMTSKILEGEITEIPPNSEQNITVKTNIHYWFVSRECIKISEYQKPRKGKR